jgi:hypothetical protein
MKLRLLLTGLLVLTIHCVLRAQTNVPPETKNAALRYWMAFAEMQDPPADKATQDLLEKTVAGQAGWNEKTLGPILDANGVAIQIMQRATKLPDCDWGLEYDQGPRASIAYAPKARVLARLNTLEGMRELAKGNSQTAMDTWLAGIRFSTDLARGGSLIFALIAKSAILPNLQALAAEAKQKQLTDSQKKQISAQLKSMPEDGFYWGAAWGLEESGGERLLAELRKAANPGATYERMTGESMPSGATVPSAEDVVKYRDYMKAVQAALNSPPDTARGRISALETRKVALSAVSRQIIPNAEKENDARREVVLARNELLESISAR